MHLSVADDVSLADVGGSFVLWVLDGVLHLPSLGMGPAVGTAVGLAEGMGLGLGVAVPGAMAVVGGMLGRLVHAALGAGVVGRNGSVWGWSTVSNRACER